MKRLGLALLSTGIVGAVVLGVLFAQSIKSRPTADQLYGCTVQQQAPNGECK